MAVSGKDIEILWQRYQVDAVPSGISVNQFFESNGVPYHVFEKWYKKKFQSPNVVDCVVEGSPETGKLVHSNVKQDPVVSPSQPNDAVVVKYINIGLSNGMKIEHHNLSYNNLQSFIQKLQSLCLA